MQCVYARLTGCISDAFYRETGLTLLARAALDETKRGKAHESELNTKCG